MQTSVLIQILKRSNNILNEFKNCLLRSEKGALLTHEAHKIYLQSIFNIF